MSSHRARLAADLQPLLPGWRIVPGLDAPDRIAKPTIVLEQAQIAPSERARGLREFVVNVHVITPKAGITDAAEDDVDALVLLALDALEKVRYLSVGTATKKVYQDSNLSYEIETTTLNRKKES